MPKRRRIEVADLRDKRIRFEHRDRYIDGCLYGKPVGRTIDAAYPLLRSRACDGGLAHPLWAVQRGLKLVRIAAESPAAIDRVRDHLLDVCLLGIEVCKRHPRLRALKADHEALLIQLAILVDLDIAREVAEVIARAKVPPDRSLCLTALGGLFAEFVLGAERGVGEQLDAYRASKLERTCSMPARATAVALVNRNVVAFKKAATRDIDKYWQLAINGSVITGQKQIVRITEKSVVMAPGRIHTNYAWPWPEAAIMKLLMLEGLDARVDTPWVPRRLLKERL